MIIFWNPLSPQPHEPDVKGLLRIAVVWKIPAVSNRASVVFMISSPLMVEEYNRLIPDYEYHGKLALIGELAGMSYESD